MPNLKNRSALLSGAAAIAVAVPAAVFLAAPASAQSCVGTVDITGTVIDCAGGALPGASGTTDATTVVTSGPGLVTSSAVDQTTTLVGDLATASDLTPAVDLTSAQDLTFTSLGAIATSGNFSDGVVLTAGEDILADVGTVSTAGTDSDGVVANALGDLDITADSVTTLGDDSSGMLLTADTIVAVCGAVSTAGDNSLGIDATATGTLDLTCGTITTTGDAADAVDLSADTIVADLGTVTTDGLDSDAITATAANDLDLTVDSVTTLQNDSNGLSLSSTNLVAACGSLSTAGNNSIGAAATATGALDFTCGRVTTTGDAADAVVLTGNDIVASLGTVSTDGLDSDAVTATSTGDLNLTSGTIGTLQNDSSGLTLNAENIVAVCGSVTTAGANSVGVDATASGSLDLRCTSVGTAGANSDGINIVNTAGPTSVTGGTIVTGGPGSIGIDVATLGTGLTTVNTGAVRSTGTGSPAAVRVAASDCATVNVNVTDDVTSTTGAGVLASSACAVAITTSAGAPVIGATSGITATSGTGTSIVLNDAVRATAGPAIDANGAAAAITVNAGGSIVGRIDLTPAADTVSNAGLFDVIGTSDFGAGTDVFNNLAGGTVRSVAGAGSLANCESFTNAGLITLVDGAADDTLTVCNNYTGTGGARLALDVGGNAGGLVADRLIVGGNAGGSTAISLNTLSGLPIIDPDGVLVVDAATASGTPFALTGPVSFGLVNFALRQTGGDTFLVSVPDAAIQDVATLGDFAQELAYQSLDAHASCASARRSHANAERATPVGVCAQLYRSEDRLGSDGRSATVFGTDLAYSDRLETRRRGAQVELSVRAGGSFEIGATAGYARSEADLASGTGLVAHGRNYGAFAQFGSPLGLYGAVLAKRERIDARIANPLNIGLVRPEVRGTAFDGEVGYRTPGFGATIDLHAGISHVRTRMADFTAGNIAFEGERIASTRGRLGARLGWASEVAPFVDARVYHELDREGGTIVRSGALFDTIYGQGRGTWGRLEAGVGGAPGGGPLVSAWLDVGDVKGWGVRAGFHF